MNKAVFAVIETEGERQQNLKLFKDWVGNWILKRWKKISKKTWRA
jgi:hypothetical protein